MYIKSLLWFGALWIYASPFLAFGAPGDLLRVVENPDPQPGDGFGYSMAIAGDEVLVGAWHDSSRSPRGGAAYLMDLKTGKKIRSFFSPSQVKEGSGSDFGISVAVIGQRLAISDNDDSTKGTCAGAVYVFDSVSGELARALFSPEPVGGEEFGLKVVSCGSNILVSALEDSNSKGVYLFDPSNGNLVRTFNNPSNVGDSGFGISLAVSGNNVLIGAPLKDDRAGAVYLFNGLTGKLMHTFTKPNPAPQDFYGMSIAFVAKNILIGAPGDDKMTGCVYLYEHSSYKLLRTFRQPLPQPQAAFGFNLAAIGDRCLIRADNADSLPKEAGIVYMFDTSTGKLQHTFRKPNPIAGDHFGVSILGTTNEILISATGASTGAPKTGAVYVFQNPLGNPNLQIQLPSAPAEGSGLGG